MRRLCALPTSRSSRQSSRSSSRRWRSWRKPSRASIARRTIRAPDLEQPAGHRPPTGWAVASQLLRRGNGLVCAAILVGCAARAFRSASERIPGRAAAVRQPGDGRTVVAVASRLDENSHYRARRACEIAFVRRREARERSVTQFVVLHEIAAGFVAALYDDVG